MTDAEAGQKLQAVNSDSVQEHFHFRVATWTTPHSRVSHSTSLLRSPPLQPLYTSQLVPIDFDCWDATAVPAEEGLSLSPTLSSTAGNADDTQHLSSNPWSCSVVPPRLLNREEWGEEIDLTPSDVTLEQLSAVDSLRKSAGRTSSMTPSEFSPLDLDTLSSPHR